MTGNEPTGRHRLGHDIAGEAYPTATTPTTEDGKILRHSEPVTSRSTDQEARDLLSLRHAKQGDTGAFADLIRANDDAVRALTWALVGPDDLDGVCTQAYLRAFRGLPLAPTTSPRIWLLGIADGSARDVLRRREQHGGSDQIPAPPVPLDIPERERLVVAALEAVGLTTWETARLIGGRVDDVRDLLHSGRSRAGVVLPLEEPSSHRRGFWNDLGRRLLVEQSSPSASEPRSMTATPTSTEPREPSGRNRRSAAIARGMARRVDEQQPRSIPWRRIALGIGGALSIVVVMVIALSLAKGASRRDAGLGDTASKTLDRLDASLARNTVVEGIATITTTDPGPIHDGTYRFTRTNTGSWRITALDAMTDEGYDVPSGTAVALTRSGPDQATTAIRRAGLAAGPPGTTGTAIASPGDVLANAIRLVRSGTAGTVTTKSEPLPATGTTTPGQIRSSTTEARSVWVVTSRIAAKTEPSSLAGTGTMARIRADEAELVADRSLALPTRLTLRRNGKTVLEIRFSALSIAQQTTRTTFAPPIPPGVTATETDTGFIPATIGRPSGVTIATPSFLPGGYVLASATTNSTTHVTVVCYRNGSRQLVITSRPRPGASDRDPFAAKSDVPVAAKEVTVPSGAFANRPAFSSTTPITHVWVDGTTSQLIAAGDPTIEQLTKVLASMR